MLLLPLDRVGGRPVDDGPQRYRSLIRGSLAARSHNYAATMRISLPMTAKQGLETFHEALKNPICPRRGGAAGKSLLFALPTRRVTH